MVYKPFSQNREIPYGFSYSDEPSQYVVSLSQIYYKIYFTEIKFLHEINMNIQKTNKRNRQPELNSLTPVKDTLLLTHLLSLTQDLAWKIFSFVEKRQQPLPRSVQPY